MEEFLFTRARTVANAAAAITKAQRRVPLFRRLQNLVYAVCDRNVDENHEMGAPIQTGDLGVPSRLGATA